MLLEPCHNHIIFIFNWTLPFLYLTLIYWIRFIFHSQFKHISCSLLWYLYYLNHILVIRITNMVTFYVMIHSSTLGVNITLSIATRILDYTAVLPGHQGYFDKWLWHWDSPQYCHADGVGSDCLLLPSALGSTALLQTNFRFDPYTSGSVSWHNAWGKLVNTNTKVNANRHNKLWKVHIA